MNTFCAPDLPGNWTPGKLAPVAPAAGAALSACGGGSSGATPALPPTPEQAARWLLQAQFSASDAEIAAVQSQGYGPWLKAQMNAPAGQKGFDWLNERGYGAIDASNFFDASYPADFMVWNQLLTAPDAMRKRCALALSEFFVVSLSGLDVAWRSHVMAHYWDTLCANALGNFRQLLQGVSLSPAMGVYLNTRGSQKEDPATGRQPDENYAREVMQLFSLGLYLLNPDGTEQLDSAGARQETYSQSDISNLARVFSGYDFDTRQNVNTTLLLASGSRTVSNTAFAQLPMLLNASRHSNLAATFLGTTIAANTDGAAALTIALDALFKHPNVGPFFGKQMIQRLAACRTLHAGRVQSPTGC